VAVAKAEPFELESRPERKIGACPDWSKITSTGPASASNLAKADTVWLPDGFGGKAAPQISTQM